MKTKLLIIFSIFSLAACEGKKDDASSSPRDDADQEVTERDRLDTAYDLAEPLVTSLESVVEELEVYSDKDKKINDTILASVAKRSYNYEEANSQLASVISEARKGDAPEELQESFNKVLDLTPEGPGTALIEELGTLDKLLHGVKISSAISLIKELIASLTEIGDIASDEARNRPSIGGIVNFGTLGRCAKFKVRRSGNRLFCSDKEKDENGYCEDVTECSVFDKMEACMIAHCKNVADGHEIIDCSESPNDRRCRIPINRLGLDRDQPVIPCKGAPPFRTLKVVVCLYGPEIIGAGGDDEAEDGDGGDGEGAGGGGGEAAE